MTNDGGSLAVCVGPFKTIDISGFGGGYEDMCQRMLWRGVAYLGERNPPVEMWQGGKQYKNVAGLFVSENDELKLLEKAIIKDGDDVTGAMHHAVMNHLAWIHRKGLAAWLAQAEKQGMEIVEWEGEL